MRGEVMEADRLMKRREAAQMLGFSESYLEKNPPVIPVVRIGRTVRYRLSDLQKIVEGKQAAQR